MIIVVQSVSFVQGLGPMVPSPIVRPRPPAVPLLTTIIKSSATIIYDFFYDAML